jgi:hypothetical protein
MEKHALEKQGAAATLADIEHQQVEGRHRNAPDALSSSHRAAAKQDVSQSQLRERSLRQVQQGGGDRPARRTAFFP